MGRRSQTLFPDGTTIQTQYDLNGNRVSITHQNGNQKRFEYDTMDRLQRVITRMSGVDSVTAYVYDEVGNLISQINPEGNQTRVEYDPLGRPTRVALPLGQARLQTYDPNGNLISSQDAGGNVITYEYDANNRLIRRTTPDEGAQTFSYLPGGRRTLAGGVTTQYDERGRLTRVTHVDGSTLEYTYDAVGNRLTTTVTTTASQWTKQYTYDPLNRLSSVVAPDDGGGFSYAYDNVGNLTSLNYPNGVTTTYQYDTLNRLTQQINSDSTGGVITSYAYTLLPGGQRSGVAQVQPDGGIRTVTYLYRAHLLKRQDCHYPLIRARRWYWTFPSRPEMVVQSQLPGYN
ncbi:RHS repeat protein [Candidatus Poribacteria bacterium]|nr:RHS repeat protein [Candidatus Poribacteria bacterium]